MLHLLPIRGILTIFAFAVAMTIVLVVVAGWTDSKNFLSTATVLMRYATSASAILCIGLLLLWRWSVTVQEYIFPYLGGKWEGTLNYGPNGGQEKLIKLEVKHSIFQIKLLLESDESESKTLAVYPEKDHHFDRYQIYYVYQNMRKVGLIGGGDVYRGLSIMRVELVNRKLKMSGNYFTETHRQGTIHLAYIEPNPFWRIWR